MSQQQSWTKLQKVTFKAICDDLVSVHRSYVQPDPCVIETIIDICNRVARNIISHCNTTHITKDDLTAFLMVAPDDIGVDIIDNYNHIKATKDNFHITNPKASHFAEYIMDNNNLDIKDKQTFELFTFALSNIRAIIVNNACNLCGYEECHSTGAALLEEMDMEEDECFSFNKEDVESTWQYDEPLHSFIFNYGNEELPALEPWEQPQVEQPQVEELCEAMATCKVAPALPALGSKGNPISGDELKGQTFEYIRERVANGEMIEYYKYIKQFLLELAEYLKCKVYKSWTKEKIVSVIMHTVI